MYLSLLRLCACFVWGQRMYALVDQRVHAIALSDTPLTLCAVQTMRTHGCACGRLFQIRQANARCCWLTARAESSELLQCLLVLDAPHEVPWVRHLAGEISSREIETRVLQLVRSSQRVVHTQSHTQPHTAPHTAPSVAHTSSWKRSNIIFFLTSDSRTGSICIAYQRAVTTSTTGYTAGEWWHTHRSMTLEDARPGLALLRLLAVQMQFSVLCMQAHGGHVSCNRRPNTEGGTHPSSSSSPRR